MNTTTATVHTIPTNHEGPGERKRLKAKGVRVIVAGAENGFKGYGVSAWAADQRNRKVFQGELEAGPHASLFGLCGWICSDRSQSMPEVMKREEAEGRLFRVEPGDVLEIGGSRFEVSVGRRGYPKLTLLAD